MKAILTDVNPCPLVVVITGSSAGLGRAIAHASEAVERAADRVEAEFGPIDIWVNDAMVKIALANGQRILMAQKGNKWMAMGATVPFSRLSCGYVGVSDGWTDLHGNFKMGA